jgi:hypothetical protein
MLLERALENSRWHTSDRLVQTGIALHLAVSREPLPPWAEELPVSLGILADDIESLTDAQLMAGSE